ncbi:NAD(P)-dependent oxidoreductase [Gemmatimonas sp.]|jgi:putative NADH-flavin reductase|uniref:NAD(P)-dependent oxidoreductase n=1 Tax=Gemmatimonas sp. TaxID=1962908 RepID=UPI0037BF09D7
MIVSVFGASGRTGHAFIASATDAGMSLRLHYRAKPSDQVPTSATVVVGSLNDPTAVREVLRGADVAVVLFGPHHDARIPFCAAATKQIIAVMHTQSQSRLLVVTGAMTGGMPSNVSPFMRFMRKIVQRSAHDGMVEDRNEQERLVRDSKLAGWTLVKPPRLTDDATTGTVDIGPDLSVGLRSHISRASLAKTLVREIQEPRFAQQAVYVANR